jgi:hypothetical protein
MSYAAVTQADATYTEGTKTWANVFTRVFSNTSGNTINVAETGLITDCQYAGSGVATLIERNLLAAPVAVANNKKITVTYTFSMTFPA